MFCVKLLSDKAEYCMAEYDVSAVRTILEDVTFDVYVQMLFSCWFCDQLRSRDKILLSGRVIPLQQADTYLCLVNTAHESQLESQSHAA